MRLPDPFQIPIYHITHIDNLPRIIKSNGLWCDAERLKQGWDSINIAHKSLKERRMNTPVWIGTDTGVLGDYVPFYFCNRSPMLYAIKNGQIAGYEGFQSSIIYIVSSVGKILSGNRKWCFTDGHAVEAITEFFDDIKGLEKIDWNLINHWSWRNTDDDNDRKRRKQAEFLVKESCPLSMFEKIAVYDKKHKELAENILASQKITIDVIIENKWYY